MEKKGVGKTRINRIESPSIREPKKEGKKTLSELWRPEDSREQIMGRRRGQNKTRRERGRQNRPTTKN